MSIKDDKLRFNMSQQEAEIRAGIQAGLSDEEIYAMLNHSDLTPNRYRLLKQSAKKKVSLFWFFWRNKDGAPEKI